MRGTLAIARTELASIFFSPIAWLLLGIFVVQGFFVLDESIKYLFYFDQMGYPVSNTLTESILSGGGGSLTVAMASSLFLYIPLLTMGVIARERYSGSIKLLLSSPVRLGQIVLGKYLALMGYATLLISVLVGYAWVGGQAFENPDYPLALAGVLGLYLLICAYVAVGLFMSCLTVHQVVAAIGTLATLAALSFVGDVAQGIPLLGDAAYWLSLSGRTQKFLQGLITTKDVLYFLTVSGMFLAFSILSLSSGRRIEGRGKKAARYAVVTAIAILTGYVSSRPILIGYLIPRALRTIPSRK